MKCLRGTELTKFTGEAFSDCQQTPENCQGTGTWDLGLGTWDLGPGTWDLGPWTWDLGPGNRIENREWRIENRISRIETVPVLTVKSHYPPTTTHHPQLLEVKEWTDNKVPLVRMSQDDPLYPSSTKITRWTATITTLGSQT